MAGRDNPRRYLRRPGLVWLGLTLLALSWLTLGFTPPGFTDGAQPTVVAGPGTLDALAWAPPVLTAPGAVALDADSGSILFGREAREARPPASTTKMMTALLALERAAPADGVVIQPSDLVGEASMGLVAGERRTVLDLLYGALLPSGNDAATALARQVGSALPGPDPPVQRFVALMNQRAEELGLAATHFTNPHGLDAPGLVASPLDLARLARFALEQPTFASIVATRQWQGAGRTLVSRNLLLGSYPGANGVKTGTTGAAGEVLVGSASRGGHDVITVVMGSSDRYADSVALLDYAFENYTWLSLELPPAASILRAGENGRGLVTSEPPRVVLARGEENLVRPLVEIDDPDAPPGRAVGQVTFRAGDRYLARVPLYAADPPAPR